MSGLSERRMATAQIGHQAEAAVAPTEEIPVSPLRSGCRRIEGLCATERLYRGMTPGLNISTLVCPWSNPPLGSPRIVAISDLWRWPSPGTKQMARLVTTLARSEGRGR